MGSNSKAAFAGRFGAPTGSASRRSTMETLYEILLK
jgi:ribosomal protein L37AE/L43A